MDKNTLLNCTPVVIAELKKLGEDEYSKHFLDNASALRPHVRIEKDEITTLWTEIRQHDQGYVDWIIEFATRLSIHLGGRSAVEEFFEFVMETCTPLTPPASENNRPVQPNHIDGSDSVVDDDMSGRLVDVKTATALLNNNVWLLPFVVCYLISLEIDIAEKANEQ